MRDDTFAGRHAVVSGASGAIGGAVARALGRRGARLLVLGRDPDRLAHVLRELREVGSDGLSFAGDLGRDESWPPLDGAIASLGGVDILVHSQGRFEAGSLLEAPVEEIDRLFHVNFRSPLLLTRLCLPSLVSRQGQVVFVNSSAALRSDPSVGAYAASKLALRSAADNLRDEVNTRGVRVMTIFPGRTASAMQREVCSQLGQTYDPERLLDPSVIATMVVEALALPRSAEVTDIHIRPMRGQAG